MFFGGVSSSWSSSMNTSLALNDLPYINCHKYYKFALFANGLSATFFIIGVPVTLLVLRELCGKRRPTGSNEFFMIHTTIGNLAYLLIVPLSVANGLVWRYRPFECVDSLMDGVILCSRPLFTACRCVDCYVAVVHPVAYRSNTRNALRKAAAGVVWLSTAAFFSHKCVKMYVYPPPLNSAPLIFALPVVVFCDVTIVRTLRKTDPNKPTIHPQKKRALQLISSSLVMMLVFYIPPVVIFSVADVVPMTPESYNCMVMVFGFMLSMCGCVLMPILYLRTMGKLDKVKNFLKTYIRF